MKNMAGMKTYLFLLIFLISSAKSLGQTVIDFPLSDVCYNETYNLKIVIPVFGASFEWQYTLYTILWEDNSSRFQTFNNEVIYFMSNQPMPETDFSMEHISRAIYSTDYTYTKDHYDLYLNQSGNRYEIAQLLFRGIIDQQSFFLTQNEYNFLAAYYYSGAAEALLVGVEIRAPYIRHDIPDWKDLGTSAFSDGSINFCPEAVKLNFTDLTKVGLRVRQSSPVTTYYSEVKNVMLKPKPPVFDVSADKSCSSTATAHIKISKVSGLYSENLYRYFVKKPDGVGWEKDFSGISPDISTTFIGGDYKVSVYYQQRAITGCSYDTNIHIDTYAKPAANILTEDATCPGRPDGQISVTFIENGLAYQISLNGNTFYNTRANTTGLKSGKYPINISDACENLTTEASIGEPAAVSFTSIKNDPTCLSAPNGSITLNAANGKGGIYDFRIFNGQNTVTYIGEKSPYSFSSLAGGAYTLQVRTGGCDWVESEESLAPVQPITFTPVITNVDCFDKSTGAISITAAGGKTPYKYSLDNQPYVSSSQFSGLHAGSYSVKVQTATESCNDYYSLQVPVDEASEIKIGLSPIDAKCFDNADGSISSSVTGGTGSYSYSWDTKGGSDWFPAGGNIDRLTGLIAGAYRLNVTDIKGCRRSMETVVGQPSALKVISATPKDVICYGTNGSISVVASGGTALYRYFCDSGEGNSYEATTQEIGLPAGSYFVKVRDANGCEEVFNDNAKVTLTGPASPLDFSANISDFHGFSLSCKNDATGRISLLTSGGNEAGYSGYMYSLNGSAFQPGNTYDRLAAGSYIARVQDARGCSVQKTIVLSEPESITLNLASVTSVKCFGTSTGEIAVNATGGIQNTYTYKLNGRDAPSSGIFRNLYPGTYSIEVSDANGCRQNMEASVQSLFPKITTALAGNDIKCFGEQNGIINATVTGGSGSFSFQWEKKINSLWQPIAGTGSILENLFPGNYRIRVTDSELCSTRDSTILNEPSKLLITSLTTKDAVCFGESGNVLITASGGKPGYSYFLSGTEGSGMESLVPRIDLLPGKYHVSVKDLNGCEAMYTDELIIDGPSVPLDFTASLSSYNGYAVSCHGGNNGKITINAAGGNGGSYSGYSYSLGGSPVNAVSSFSDLIAGVYTAKVKDERGCIVQKTFTLNEPEPLGLILLHSFPVKCHETADGEIAVSATGGLADSYRFSLNGKDPSSSGIFSNLQAGEYHLGLTDGNGCLQSLSATVAYKNLPLEAILTSEDISCYGYNNGKIHAEISGGAGNFSYLWESKSEADWKAVAGNTGSLQNLSPGLYRLRATDLDNCPTSDSVEVKQPDPLQISGITIKDAVCYGDSGSMSITARGGNPGYLFQYSPAGGSEYYNYLQGQPLRPASYNIKVKDTKNCELTREEPIMINRPALALNFTFAIRNYNGFGVSCHGNQDGELTVIPSGGNGNQYSGYTYQLSGRQAQSESFFSQLKAGSYDIMVKDGRGCSITQTATLTEPSSEITFKASFLKNPVCVNDSNGEISLFASGGAEPYTWSVNDGEFLSSSKFLNLHAGNYAFRVRDANGCGNEFDTALVNTVKEMNIAGVITGAKCFGESSGTITLQISGGAKPYSYRWKDNPSTTSFAGNLYRGDHLAWVSDSAGCKMEKTFFVSEPQSPLSVSATSMPACVSLSNGEIHVLSTGGTPPYRFAVDRQAGFTETDLFKVFSGKHTIYASDKNDCTANTVVGVGTKNIMPDQNFMLATSRYEQDTVVLIDVSVPRPDMVKWQFPDEAVVIDTSSSKARVSFKNSGIWPVKMTGYFGECIYTIEKLLNIAPFDPLIKEKDSLHKGIKSVKISPNPSDGHFELKIELYTKQQVSISILDYYSRLIYNEKYPADIEFTREIFLPSETLPGTYFIRITGENDARSEVLVISK
jgi:hypothetical protein